MMLFSMNVAFAITDTSISLLWHRGMVIGVGKAVFGYYAIYRILKIAMAHLYGDRPSPFSPS